MGANFELCQHFTTQYKSLQSIHLPSAEITVPRVTRDLLMLAPSFSLSPVAPVASALSLQNEYKNQSVNLTVARYFTLAASLIYDATVKKLPYTFRPNPLSLFC